MNTTFQSIITRNIAHHLLMDICIYNHCYSHGRTGNSIIIQCYYEVPYIFYIGYSWSCLEIRMQDEFTVWGLIIVPS